LRQLIYPDLLPQSLQSKINLTNIRFLYKDPDGVIATKNPAVPCSWVYWTWANSGGCHIRFQRKELFSLSILPRRNDSLVRGVGSTNYQLATYTAGNAL